MLGGLWSLLVLSLFFQRFPLPVRWPVLLERCRDLSAAALLCAAAVVLGFGILCALGTWRRLSGRHGTRLLFAAALGYGALGLGTWLLARLQWLRPLPVGILLVTLLAGWLPSRGLHRTVQAFWKRMRPAHRRRDLLGTLLLLVLGLCMALMLLEALAPPTSYDALRYQLRLPQLYADAGGWVDVPYDFNAAFPGNVNMLFTLAFTLGAPGAAKLTHLLLGWLAMGAVALLATQAAGRRAGLPAAAVFYSMPVVALNSAWAYVDMGMTLFLLSAVAAIMLWWRRPERTWPVVAGILAGLALGTKYTAAAALVALPLVVLTRPMGHGAMRWGAALRAGVVVAGLGLLVSAPWWTANWVERGNPVYPFAASVFPAGDSDTYRAERHRAVLSRPEVPLDSAEDVLLLPWRFAMKPWVRDEMIGPALLVGLPLLFAAGGAGRRLFWLAMVFALLWGLQSPQVRLYLHGLALLSAAVGAGVVRLQARRPGPGRWAAAGLLVAVLFSAGNLAVVQKALSDPFPVVVGMESRGRYLERMVDGHDAIAFINRELPAHARVLFVGEIYGYHCRRDYLLGSKFDRPPLLDFVVQSGSLEGLMDRLHGDGFTHLLYSMHQLKQFHDLPGRYLDWPDETSRGIYRRFMTERLEMMYEGEQAVVARIRFSPPGDAPQTPLP
jgi:hypothetical protein